MSRKVVLPPYEQMLLTVAQMDADELENIIRCARVMLAQKKPRAARKSKPKAPKVEGAA